MMSFFRSGVQTLLVRLSLTLLTFGIGIINARWLGPEGVGVVALLLLVKTFAFRFGNLGFGSSFVFFVAKRRADIREIIPMAGKISLILSTASLLIFFAFWKTSASPWNDIGFSVYAMALGSVPFTFFNNFFQRLLSGRLRITQVNVASALSGFFHVLFTALFVIAMKTGVAGAVFATLLSDMVMSLVLFHHARAELKIDTGAVEPVGGEEKDGLVRRLWRYGQWNYLLMFSNLLVEEVPTVLLKKFTGDNALVGFFNRARSLGRHSQLVIEPLAGLLFAFTAASKDEEATRRTNLLCRNSIIIMGLAISILTFFIKPIIRILYGEAFLPSAEIFYALAPGVIIFPFGHFLEVHVSAAGKPRDIFIASVSTLIVAVVACLTLVPRFGAVGTGLSVSVIYLARALFRFVAYIRMTRVSMLDVLLPKRQDISCYQYVFRMLSTGMMKKLRLT